MNLRNANEKKKANIEIIISAISTILVLLTLFEMKAERNAAYKPEISISNSQIAIVWDENGRITNEGETYDIISNMVEKSQINNTPTLKIYNIGVGTAKDINICWNNDKNFNQYIESFKYSEDIEVVSKYNSIFITTENQSHSYGGSQNVSFDFMLSSTKEYNELIYPLSYFALNQELCIREQFIPEVLLTLSFSDVQGTIYTENIKIVAQKHFSMSYPDGTGGAIIFLNAEKGDSIMNLFNITSNDLTAITSVFAVIISVISLVFTYKSNKNQMEHNVNSVRPISFIKLNDYEDMLSVEVCNHGTGPLLIKRLVAKNNSCETSALIKLMPKINQNWSDFTEVVDGRSIPVGKSIILVKIYPKSKEIKKLIRKTLSEITIELEYTDIYSNEFKDKRLLDFFGRTLSSNN